MEVHLWCRVTITGTNLAYVKSVCFGTGRASYIVVLSAREIKVIAPAGSGTVNIRVTTVSDLSVLVPADQFTY